MGVRRPVCVVVDAWSTGRELQPVLAEAGWDCVHVWSRPDQPKAWRRSYVARPYVDEFVHDGDPERTAARLSVHRPGRVIVGAESGVELADLLAARLGLVGNDPQTSGVRRDKFLMAEAVLAAGLPAVEQHLGASVDDVVAWAEACGRWPVVVKPRRSAGTDNVHVCRTPDEARRAAGQVLRSADFTGDPNHGALVQQFLHGVEYMIDTVSWEGVHRVTEMWRCVKRSRGSSQIYDVEELLPFEGPEQAEIVPYVGAVLEALGLAYGPAHVELVRTASGPVLVEVNARLHGSIDRAAVAACVDHDHVAATALALTRPAEFLAMAGRPYRLRRNSLCVILMSPRTGRLVDMPGASALRDLPSYFSTLMFVHVGDEVRTTVDLWTAPGGVYLVHSDPDVLWRDYRRIRELEQSELFTIVG
jgi:biotin carboxylase